MYGRINPLQIRPAPRDSEDEPNEEGGKLYNDTDGMSDMALHIKNMEIFFQLYLPSLNDMQKAILKQSIIELYQKFGIDWGTDISGFTNEQFPTFRDLY